jgi:outer membrane protein
MPALAADEPVVGEDVYTLDEIYRLALDRSEAVGISVEDLYLAHQTRKKAFSVLVPEISAYGSYTRYELNDSSLEFISGPDSTTSWGLSLSQTFTLNGKELIALKITGETIEKSEYDLSTVKEEFLLGVAAAYYDVLKAVKTVDIARANVDRLTTYRDSVSIKLGLEEVAKTDMYRAEAELSSAKANMIAAENAVKYTRAALSQLSGVGGDYTVSDVSVAVDPTKTVEIDALKETAWRQRSELKAAEKQQIIAGDQVRYYRGEYWPKLTLAGNYSQTESEPGEAFVMSNEDLSFSLTANFSLFDGGLKKAQVAEAHSQKRQADLAFSATKKQITLQVEQAYLEVVTARSVLDSLEDQVTFARHNYDAVLKQYQYGIANSVDIMDANTSLVTAERQLSDADYTYQLAILKLRRTQGVFLSDLEGNGLL